MADFISVRSTSSSIRLECVALPLCLPAPGLTTHRGCASVNKLSGPALTSSVECESIIHALIVSDSHTLTHRLTDLLVVGRAMITFETL